MIAERIIGNLLGPRINRELYALVKAYTEQSKFSGSVLVARGGEVLLSKGYGMANREHDVENTPETVFRLGSMTKPFTAIAIMQLVEESRVSVEDTVSQHFPDFPNGQTITIHHLLSNTSGIPDYITMQEYEPIMTHRKSVNDLIALFRDKSLQYEPGTAFNYSNSNWVLLGAIIEQVRVESYADVIRQHIFEPAGMLHSGYAWEQTFIKHRASGYIDTGAGLLNTEVVDESTMHAAGALYSTVEDLYRWDRALRNESLLRQSTLQGMFTPVQAIDGQGYGYGWTIESLHQRRNLSHSGGIPGFVSNIARFVDEGVVIIILSNLGSAAFPEMTRDLAAIVFNEPYQMPLARQFVSVDPAVFADYVGDYNLVYFGRTTVLTFTVEGDKLVMKTPGLAASVLSPMSESKFYARSKGDVEMTFLREADGRVNSITMVWSGYNLTATRLN